jgi:hypothetical protein
MAVMALSASHCSILALPLQSSAVSAQKERTSENAPVFCSPEKPTVWPREVILVRAWASTTDPQSRYTWTATGGQIGTTGSETKWDFTGVKPGSYSASVQMSNGTVNSNACSVAVIVMKHEGDRGERETGRSFLVGTESEAKGFGLYSYLLFGSPPDETSHQRYLKAVEAYLQLIPDITSLEKYLGLSVLNVTYLPLREAPPKIVSAQWVLDHYNYARARALLKALPGSYRDGPYIVSSLTPMDGIPSVLGKYLYQDLSSVPPDLVLSWEKEFLNQAAQERFWDERSAEILVLKLRTTIGILAVGLPDVQKSLEGWIAWKSEAERRNTQ